MKIWIEARDSDVPSKLCFFLHTREPEWDDCLKCWISDSFSTPHLYDEDVRHLFSIDSDRWLREGNLPEKGQVVELDCEVFATWEHP